MSHALTSFYRTTITSDITTHEEYTRFMDRIKRGNLLRTENPISHTVAMMLVFDEATRQILVVHHKKAGSWILPGGHIENGEIPMETAIRELGEEVGLVKENIQLLGPFSAQVADITNPRQICREHFDVFYAVNVPASSVIMNMREFFAYEWLSPEAAREKMALDYYKEALDRFILFMKW